MNATRNLKMFVKKKIFQIKYNIKFGEKSRFYNCKFEGDNMLGRYVYLMGSSIGRGTYIAFNSTIYWTKIGRYCSIGDNVRIGLGNHPINENISTHPAFYKNVKKSCGFTFHNDNNDIFNSLRFVNSNKKYVVEIGNDVWIGANAMIMDGVKINDGAIIAGGAIVTKDVEPYSVIAGIPAKTIKYRFSDEYISILNDFKWWNMPIEWIKKNYYSFSNPKGFINKIKNKIWD